MKTPMTDEYSKNGVIENIHLWVAVSVNVHLLALSLSNLCFNNINEKKCLSLKNEKRENVVTDMHFFNKHFCIVLITMYNKSLYPLIPLAG